MPSTIFKQPVRGYVLRMLNMIIICFLLFLAIYQYQYRDSLMVKLGMSHFFSPTIVGFLPWCLIAINIAGAFTLIFWTHPRAVWPAIMVLVGYTLYNILLLITTGSSCGCSNIFFDIDLWVQIIVGFGLILLAVFSWYMSVKALKKAAKAKITPADR